jgi:hypothetical protein
VNFSDPHNFPIAGSLGSATTDANGNAAILLDPAITTVVATISDAGSLIKGAYVFTGLTGAAAANATLQLRTVAGKVAPSTGSYPTTGTPKVSVKTSTGLGPAYDGIEVASAVPSALGVYSVDLFGATNPIPYTLSALLVDGFPDATKVPASVKDVAINNLDLPVSPGGFIFGKVQSDTNLNLSGVNVSVWASNPDGTFTRAASGPTSASGDYAFQVPFGTYFMLVGGAITPGVTVSTQASQATRNFTRYTVFGHVAKSIGGGSTTAAAGATVYSGSGSTTTATLGNYSMQMYEGQNYVCVRPSAADATYGYVCQTNVLVNDATVAASNQ